VTAPGATSLERAHEESGRRGGILRILSLGNVDHLDPQRSYYMLGVEILRCVVRSLMTYPGRPAPHGADVVPDLAAEEPEISADRLTYTFRIRKDARFGPPVSRPVVSGDFAHAFRRLLAPGTRGPVHVYLEDVVGADELLAGRTDELSGVECPDDETLVVRLRRPLNDFLNVLALPATSPIPAELASRSVLDERRSVVATGPYTVDRYDPTRVLHLVRNPGWAADSDPSRAAWVDQIVVEFNTPWGEILTAIERDEADIPAIVNPDPDFVSRYSTDEAFADRWHSSPTNCARYVTLNTGVPPLDDPRVRQAISYAIDKQALRAVKGGEAAGGIATAILPPTQHGHRAHDTYPSPGHRGDLERATRLLEDAGYPDGFDTWALVFDTGYGPAIGETVQASLAGVGIDVEVRAVSIAEYMKRLGDPGAAVPIGAAVGWCADWPGHGARTFIRPFFHSGSIGDHETTNFSFYADPEVDALIERAEEAAPEAAGSAWAEVDERIMRDAPCVPWLYDNHFDLVSSRVRNYFAHPFLVGCDWANVWLEGA
jgi:peptide/nickel transport system substrate-binding protein